MNALSSGVILEPDQDDGGLNVVIPSFPSAHTQGDDVEEALRNAREVIVPELGYLAEKGLSIRLSDAEDVRNERVSVAHKLDLSKANPRRHDSYHDADRLS